MTDRDASDSSPRFLLTTRFLRTLADRQRSERERRHAARLLSLFAIERDGAQLEAILLEPAERDPWVRTYLLRAIVRQRLTLTDRGLARLCAVAQDNRNGHGDFTCVLLAARSPAQDRIVRAALDAASAPVARDVLLATAQLPPATRAVAYQRYLELDPLDDTVAWATLDQPASQRLVLDRDPLDLVKLAYATTDCAHADLAAMFAGRPNALQRALAAFALPPSFVAARVDESTRHDNAVRLIDTVADQLVAGRRFRGWSALRAALDSLREPARHLDAVIAAHPAVLTAVAWFRARCEPAPHFDDFPLEIVHDLLSRLTHDPSERDRAVLVWLANQPAPRLHHAGLRGLLLLDRGCVDATLVDRLAHSDEPLVRLLALEARLSGGDAVARTALIEAAGSAPHVVLRAQALRSLRRADVSPEVFRTALRGDHASFEDFYLPAASEAALGLARGAAITELEALTELVDAHLVVDNDDAPHAIESAIRSWLEGTAATMRPVWYASYMRR